MSTGLRYGWTTGACATAAAYTALLTGEVPDPVRIDLPRGLHPSFALARESLGEGTATVGIVKDAGDDPVVTHGALGPGVGTLREAPVEVDVVVIDRGGSIVGRAGRQRGTS